MSPEPSLPGLHAPSLMHDSPPESEGTVPPLDEVPPEEDEVPPELEVVGSVGLGFVVGAGGGFDGVSGLSPPTEVSAGALSEMASIWSVPLMVESPAAFESAVQMSMRDVPLPLNAPPVSTTLK